MTAMIQMTTDTKRKRISNSFLDQAQSLNTYLQPFNRTTMDTKKRVVLMYVLLGSLNQTISLKISAITIIAASRI